MRYLNRVVFINSANIKYAEVAIDGNVHFIGTQGVGKSTCLRAILFFYNADKVKLGIEKGKRTFDDYYFPFGNSYIVYEVMRETGPYCVLAFKSQGRTCFRFLDGLYEKNHFIDGSGKVKTWDAVRDGLDKKTTYTRKIDRYEEYRDILYGNNRGLSAEFRKFSLIESRQYQNIPRTIQNVFLNSKLEAEFIKQTIIMSLNEEDVKIELDKYAHHLHDFDVQLSDISKWNEQNRSGEVPVRKQADAVQKLYASIRYLEHDKAEMAAQLLYVHQLVLNELPQSEKDHELIMEKRSVQQQKLHELDHKFQQKREEIKKEIHILENDLKKVKQKSDEYERLGIHDIIARVSKKTAKERELKHLKEEKDLLSAKFKEVDVYYQALIKQEENVFNSSVNELQADKNKLETDLLSLKNTICLQYQELLDEIRQQNKENLKAISNSMAQKKDAIHELKSKKQKASLQRYFEKEIDETNQEFITLKEQIKITAFEAADQKKQIETLQKQWELDTERNTAEIETKADKINEENAALNNAIALIDEKLARHGDSFYGWLSDHVPDWQNTIGKVVDEDMVLFHSGLSPAISSEKNDTLFGVKIDVSEINKTVKSVEDHQHERSLLLEKISGLVKRTDELNEQKNEYSEKLKRKYQPKIKELKDAIYQAEYANEKAENDLQRNRVRSLELKQKAEAEKNNAISALNAELEKASDELIKEEQNFSNTENTGQKQLEQKEKEKKKKIQAEELLVNDKRNTLVADFEIKKQQNNRRIAELKEQQVKELLREGADTNRLTEIERKIIDLESELVIIENDRNKVVEYNKDKKELFDHEDRFKAEKKLKESQLGAEQEKYSTQKTNFRMK